MKPANGIVLIEPLEDKSAVLTSSKPTTRVLKGKVIDIGSPLTTDFGATIVSNLKKGQTAYFLSYEGGYDVVKQKGQEIFMVKFQDIRGYEE